MQIPQYAFQASPVLYYPGYHPASLPDAAEEEPEDEPRMADILGWGRRQGSSREWESETHAQYTYASVPQYYALPGTTAQPPLPAGGATGAPAAEAAATATQTEDLHTPAGVAADESQRHPASPVTGAVQQVAARRSRPKPPFHLYGHGNIRPTCGGVVYGDYMATHNRNAGSDLPEVLREPALARGDAQVHFHETDMRRTVAENRHSENRHANVAENRHANVAKDRHANVAENKHVNRYTGLPEYDPRRYAAGPEPSSQSWPSRGPEPGVKKTTAGLVPSPQAGMTQGPQPGEKPRANVTAGPPACAAAGTTNTVGVGTMDNTPWHWGDRSMWQPTMPTAAGQYMLPPSVPFVPRNLGMEHNPRQFKTLPPSWLRQVPAAGLHSRRQDNLAW